VDYKPAWLSKGKELALSLGKTKPGMTDSTEALVNHDKAICLAVTFLYPFRGINKEMIDVEFVFPE